MGIQIINTDNRLVITKSKFSFIKDWLIFFLYALVLFLGIAVLLYFGSIVEAWHHFFLYDLLFLLFYYFINYKNLKFNLFSIQKLSEGYFKLNNDIIINIADKPMLIKYEYAGELLIEASGNLFLKVRNLEFRLCNGISDDEFKFIVENLKEFLSIQNLKIDYQRNL